MIPFDTEICPCCPARVRADRLERHIHRVHCAAGEEVEKSFGQAIRRGRGPIDAGLQCPLCPETVATAAMRQHLDRRHCPAEPELHTRSVVIPHPTRPANGLRVEGDTERCSGCRSRVLFLYLTPHLRKAFELDTRPLRRHVCGDPIGASAYAWQGGAMESNRRKH